MDGYAPIGADPEEEQVPEEAGHGLPHSEDPVHPQVEPIVLGCYSVVSWDFTATISTLEPTLNLLRTSNSVNVSLWKCHIFKAELLTTVNIVH